MLRQPGSRRLLPLLLAFALLSAPAAKALAVDLRFAGALVGILSSDGPVVASAQAGGAGVNFWAMRSLVAGGLPFSETDLRWLQRAAFSRPVEGFPDRPFIDPRSGQSLGGIRADAEPWYDISGPTRNTLSLTGGGDDAWVGDGPYAPFTLAPLEFIAETWVMVIDELRKEAFILGGVRWGYTLSGLGASPIGATSLSDGPAYRASLAGTLAADFPGWKLVPEPGTALLVLLGLGVLAVAPRSRRSFV